MLAELKQLKEEFPDRVLIASIMVGLTRDTASGAERRFVHGEINALVRLWLCGGCWGEE